MGIPRSAKLSKHVGIPSGLAELGVKEADFEVMATNAKKDACQFTNPRTANLQQVIGIFMSAMGTHAVGSEDIRAVA